MGDAEPPELGWHLRSAASMARSQLVGGEKSRIHPAESSELGSVDAASDVASASPAKSNRRAHLVCHGRARTCGREQPRPGTGGRKSRCHPSEIATTVQ